MDFFLNLSRHKWESNELFHFHMADPKEEKTRLTKVSVIAFISGTILSLSSSSSCLRSFTRGSFVSFSVLGELRGGSEGGYAIL